MALTVALIVWAASAQSLAAAGFAVASALLWITGLRASTLWLRSGMTRASAEPPAFVGATATPQRIALLYCVADDADTAGIAASMRQDIPVTTIILDDSREGAARAEIDAFARISGCRVLRRDDRSGFKAGNLNHARRALAGQFDAFVVCDSDVALPPTLARVCAAQLADPAVALAQAAPQAGPGRTWFARYFGPLLATHLGVMRRGRAAHGIVAFLGRGAMVRASALDDVGGFPEAVAEDLALTVVLRQAGWRLVNADITFTEDYPIDYRAFRTQMRKTTEGAVEFLQSPRRLRGLRRRERLDVALETCLVPIAAIAGVLALVSGAVLAAHASPPPQWALVLTALSALAPLLPEAVRRAQTRGVAAGIAFGLIGGALYGSTMFVVLSAVLRTCAGRGAVFWTTPKRVITMGPRQLLHLLRADIILAPLLVMVVALAAGSPLMALAVLGPLGVALAFSIPGLRAPGVRVAALRTPAVTAAWSVPPAARPSGPVFSGSVGARA